MQNSKLIYGLLIFFLTFYSSLFLVQEKQLMIDQTLVKIEQIESQPNIRQEPIEIFCTDTEYKCDSTDYKYLVTEWTKRIESDPTNADNYLDRSSAYRNLGEYEKAIADVNKAIQINPTESEYYFTRGLFYGDQEKFDFEIADYTKAMELDPEDGSYYHNRAIAYNHKNLYKEAIADSIKEIDMEEHPFSFCFYYLANSYSKIGSYSLAVKYYSKAINLNPHNPLDAYKERAEIYLKLGKKKKAEADRKMYEKLSKNQ